MKTNSIYKLIKFVIFVIGGVLVLVFNNSIMNNDGAILNGLVGLVIGIYGLEGVLVPLLTKNVIRERVEFLNGIINILISIIMIFLLEGNTAELRTVCVIWSLWSIIREGIEVFDKGLVGFKDHPVTSMVNIAESVVVVVFSILLICANDHHELIHHAHAHVILLGIELIIEVVWVYVGDLEEKLVLKLRSKDKK